MTPQLPAALSAASVTWLPAEASTRRFARLVRPRGVDRPTAVAMVFSPRTPPAEVTRVGRSTRLLGELGFPVPTTYAGDPEARWILQEDLGDTTLAAARQRGEPVAEAYSEAVRLLDHLDGHTLETSPKPPLDKSRLRLELDHFASAALGLTEGPGAGLSAEFDALVDAALAGGLTLCHRDYHSRNLMLHEGRVRVVDHQDALLGPVGYDRVSLAYDPYVALSDAIRDRIAGEGEHLDAVAVQRLAKALGTFGEKGGKWRTAVVPAATQARRLLKRSELKAPLLDLAFASLVAGARDDEASRAAS